MSSEKVLVIVEMDGTFLGVTAGDFVDVRVINWAAIREEGGLWCPECGHDEAEPDMTTASDAWICVECKGKFEREPQGSRTDDGPGPEYVEAFNAHIQAIKAPPAFPFETRGFGKWPTRLEMIRLNRLVQRMLCEPDDDPNGEPIVCEYQVGWRTPGNEWEEYYQSWPSAVRCFHKYIDAHRSTNHEAWIHLDVFTVDKNNCKNNSIGNMEMLVFADGEYLVPWPW